MQEFISYIYAIQLNAACMMTEFLQCYHRRNTALALFLQSVGLCVIGKNIGSRIMKLSVSM